MYYNPNLDGLVSFTYTLTNIVGSSTATVEINVNALPLANDDNTPVDGQGTYSVSGSGPFAFVAGSLFADNGAGTDDRGFAQASITSFGPTTGTETAQLAQVIPHSKMVFWWSMQMVVSRLIQRSWVIMSLFMNWKMSIVTGTSSALILQL